jgi:hypothetical protein
MRSSLVVRASDCHCTSCNGPGFDPSIRRHSGIWGAADEAVLNILRKKIKKSPKKSPLWKRYSFLFSGRVGLAMSWFSRPSLLLFLYGVPSLGLALAILSLYSRLASRQGCGSLLTCLLVKSSPMVQVGPLREHLLRIATCSHLTVTRTFL